MLEVLRARDVCRFRPRSCEVAEYVRKREVCRLMLLTLSFSTGSEYLRPQMFFEEVFNANSRLFAIFHKYFLAEANLEEREHVEFSFHHRLPRNVFFSFFDPAKSDAKSYGCDIFHLCTSVMCHCVTALAHTSTGPLSLKQNGVFTHVITSGCTDCTLRTLATLVAGLSCCPFH